MDGAKATFFSTLSLFSTEFQCCAPEVWFSSLSYIIDCGMLNPFFLLVNILDWCFFTAASPGFHKSSSSSSLKRMKFTRRLPLGCLTKLLRAIWVKITPHDFPLGTDPSSHCVHYSENVKAAKLATNCWGRPRLNDDCKSQRKRRTRRLTQKRDSCHHHFSSFCSFGILSRLLTLLS